MDKRVYISADYDKDSGDRNVVEELNNWGTDNYHKVDFVDMAKVVSGSVSNDPDCCICDLKAEFNRQINASSAAIFVIGDKTRNRTAGSSCERHRKEWYECLCTPYKQNANGLKFCKHKVTCSADPTGDVGSINSYSYLRHEFEQAKRRGKKIIVLYNSMNKQESWLPWYMSEYKDIAKPFWMYDGWGNKVGNYQFIKEQLGYE